MGRAIDHLTSGNAREFQKQVHDHLMAKLADRLEIERMAVASKMFGSEPQEGEEEPSTDGEQE